VGSSASLISVVVFSSIGMGYIIYGRKQRKAFALFSGIGLCAFPYFVSNVLISILIGIGLMALPYFIEY